MVCRGKDHLEKSRERLLSRAGVACVVVKLDMKVYQYTVCGETYPVTINTNLFYENGRRAIRLIHADDGDVVATATVNLPDKPLGDDEVLIKTWSENEGMLEFLTKNEIVVDLNRSHTAGAYARAAICKLLI